MSASNLAIVLAPPPGPAVAPQRRTADARPVKNAEAFSAALDETSEQEPKAPAAAPKPVRAANDSKAGEAVEATSDDDHPAKEAEAAVPAPAVQSAPPIVPAPLPQPTAAASTGDVTATLVDTTPTAAPAEAAAPVPTASVPTAPVPAPAAEEAAEAAKAEAASDAATQAQTLAQAQTEKQAQAPKPTPTPATTPVVAPPPAKLAPTPASAAPADDAEETSPKTSPDAPPAAEAQPSGRVRDVIERASAKSQTPAAPTAQPETAPQALVAGNDIKTAPAASPVEPALARQPVAEADAPLAALTDSLTSAQPTAAPTPELRTAQTIAASPVLSSLSHAAIDATAQIAAQIVKKFEGRSTRFEIALTPDDLGRVDVSLDIDADGQLAARLAFDNPLAAADLRGRVDELRRQLQDAGFTVADDALSFAERDPAAGQGNAFDRGSERGASRAFGAASRLSADAEALAVPPRWMSLTLTPDRVDLKV